MKKFATAVVSESLPTYGVTGIFARCILYTFSVENPTEDHATALYNNSRKVFVFLDFVERGETGGR